jgi:hypothetical protein
MELNWNLIRDKKYPKPNIKILLYLKVLKNPMDKSLEYIEFITESKMKKDEGGIYFEALFSKYDERNIIAWSYFEYPKFD